MTSSIDHMGDRAFASPAGGSDNQKIFIRAQRHSRRVRTLRYAVPGIAAVVLGFVWFTTWLDPMRMIARLPTASGQLAISGSKIVMQSPKLAGFTRDARPYELNAKSATQDITNPDVVELSDLRAKMVSQDNTSVTVTALDGVFNRKSGILKLARDVVVKTSDIEVNLIEATLDTASNNVVSDNPVHVKMLQGTVKSKRLEVTGGGEVVRFIGDVRMVLDNLPDMQQQQQQQQPQRQQQQSQPASGALRR